MHLFHYSNKNGFAIHKINRSTYTRLHTNKIRCFLYLLSIVYLELLLIQYAAIVMLC